MTLTRGQTVPLALTYSYTRRREPRAVPWPSLVGIQVLLLTARTCAEFQLEYSVHMIRKARYVRLDDGDEFMGYLTMLLIARLYRVEW